MVQRRQDMVREARKLSAKTHKEANAESAVQQKEQPENVAGDPAEEVRGVQESELFSGADADKLSLYAELLNVQEKMPKTVDADSAFFKEIEWKCERLQGEYDKVSEQVKEHSPQEALTILSDGLENAFTQMLAYNDMRKAGGQSPFAVDQFISGAIDPDVRKEISDHSASLSDEEKTQYSGIAKVMVADFTSDPNAKNQTELSVVARIAGGEKIDTAGAKTFAQAKTAVSEHVGVMRTQQIKTLVDQKLANGLTPKDIVALSSKALGIEMSTVGAIPKDDVTVFEQINNGLELLSHNLDAEAAKDNGIVGRLQKADPAQYPEDLKALIGERTEGKEGDDLVQAKDAAINEYAITIAGAAVGQQLLIQSMALRLAYNNSLEPQNKELVTVAGTDKDVRADMVNHFQSLSETEQTQYLALSQEVLSNLNGSLQVADAYVTSIGDLDMSGTQNIDQAKTLVTDYQAQQYQDAVDDSVETVKYFGGAYGLKAGPIEDVLRQAFSLYVNKSATFLKQIDKEGVSIEGVGELAKRDVFIAESMKNPEILEALENGTFTKEQIESSVQQNYEQLSGQLAMAMMQKELTCMLAYNQGVATKSEHITTVEGADAKVEQGRKYLEHIKGENPDLHTKIVERAGDIIGNFGNAANFLAAELKKGKTLQVTSPSSEVAESAPDDKVEETVTQYKTVMVPDIPEGMQERFRRLEQALGMLAPDLNDRKEYKGFDIAPEKELQGPGEVDGVFDEKAYASYKGVMGHLNFLTGLSENKPLLINAKLDEAARGLNPLFGDNESAQLAELMDKDDPQKFLSEEKEVKALEKMLIGQVDDKLEALGADTRRGKIKYAKGKIKDAKEVEYANEIDELKASKKLISQVIKDLKVLDKAGLLNGPIEMVATQVPVEVSKIQVAKNAAGNDASGATESAISTVIGGTKDVPKDVPKDVVKEETPSEKEPIRTIQDDIGDVKKMLLLVGDKINNIDIPGLGSGGYFKDFISGVVKPLSKEELADDEKFGENAQNLASTLIMGLKTLNGEKDANGYYDKHVGESLKKAILTNPQFAPIRNALNDTLELEGGKIGFYGFDPSIKPTDAQRKERGQYLADLMNYEKREPIEPPELAKYEKELEAYRKSGEVGEEPVEPPEVTKYMAAMDVYEEFGKKNKEELKGIERLNTFFISMNNLQENGHYDNEQARGVNKYNMMLDFASKALDKYFPGLKNTIKSFFTNNSIGQLLGSVLGYKGIDIARLWGEKRNLSDPLEHVKQMKKDFGKIYDEAAKDKDLGDDAKPAEIVEKAQEMANDGMNKGLSGVAFKAAMRLVYKGEDKGFMQKVINNAYDAAEGATSKEEASTLFAKSVQKALDGKEFSVQEKSEIKKDAQELEKGYGDQVPAAPVNAAVAAQTMVSPPKSIDTPAAVDMKPADSNKHYVDTVSINVGNQIVCLSYAPREEAIDQGPLRLSKGRVEVLQDVLARNEENLGLSFDTDAMKINGKFSDMATRRTCAILEETLIRAKLHQMGAIGKEITQEDLDGIMEDLKQKGLGAVLGEKDDQEQYHNLNAVIAYMKDKGVSQEDRDAFKETVENLAEDNKSSRLKGDPELENSVLDQSFLGGQIRMDIMQVKPDNEIKPIEKIPSDETVEETYEKVNGGKKCEVPVFYMKEGRSGVFAAIRDKKGTLDKSDDEIRELEFRHYKSQNTIQTSDMDDVKALTDNYNWRNSNKEGVRAVINKVLGLGPEEYEIKMRMAQADAQAQEKPQEEQPTATRQAFRPAEHTPPECFKDFRSVDAKMSVELADTLKLTDHPAIKQISEGDIRDPLEVLFDLEANEIHRAGASKQTGVIFLELERYGVEHPEADVVMGIRRSDNGEWDLRYVNYNEDKIRPLSQQRASCCNDIKEIVDPRTTNPNTNDLTMPRHLDHVLFFYDYSQNDANRRTMMTPHKAGYSSMHGIIPGGGGYEIKNGFTAVYDSTDARDRDVYTRATAHNYNITTGYKVDMKYNNGNVNTQVLNGGISRAEKDVDRYNQQRRGFVQPRNTRGARDNGRDRGEPQEDQRSHRQGEFNDKSGCNPFPVTSWLNDKLGKIPLVGFLSKGVLEPLAMQFEVAPRKWKHGPNFTKEDLCPSETEQSDEKIHQNRSDCGCESGPYDRGYAVNHPDQTHDNTSALGSSY